MANQILESIFVSPTNTAAMLKHEDIPWITLVTCEDYQQTSGTYSYRRLVRAVLVDMAREK